MKALCECKNVYDYERVYCKVIKNKKGEIMRYKNCSKEEADGYLCDGCWDA